MQPSFRNAVLDNIVLLASLFESSGYYYTYIHTYTPVRTAFQTNALKFAFRKGRLCNTAKTAIVRVFRFLRRRLDRHCRISLASKR